MLYTFFKESLVNSLLTVSELVRMHLLAFSDGRNKYGY